MLRSLATLISTLIRRLPGISLGVIEARQGQIDVLDYYRVRYPTRPYPLSEGWTMTFGFPARQLKSGESHRLSN